MPPLRGQKATKDYNRLKAKLGNRTICSARSWLDQDWEKNGFRERPAGKNVGQGRQRKGADGIN